MPPPESQDYRQAQANMSTIHLSAGISISAIMLAFWPQSHLPRPCFSDRVPLCCSNWPLTHYTISLALNLRIILSQLLECQDSRYVSPHLALRNLSHKLRRKTMREPTFMPTLHHPDCATCATHVWTQHHKQPPPACTSRLLDSVSLATYSFSMSFLWNLKASLSFTRFKLSPKSYWPNHTWINSSKKTPKDYNLEFHCLVPWWSLRFFFNPSSCLSHLIQPAYWIPVFCYPLYLFFIPTNTTLFQQNILFSILWTEFSISWPFSVLLYLWTLLYSIHTAYEKSFSSYLKT